MDNKSDITAEIKKYVAVVDSALKDYLQKDLNQHTGDLHTALEYSMFPGGKRIRPLVLIGAYQSAGGTGNDIAKAMPYACALEMIHAYSLIHDDLPAMDDSDTRRGKPSSHIKFGEATAILAGDGLLNMAYETMLEAALGDSDFCGVKAAFIIAEAAGVSGMVGGQAADMYYENKKADEDAVLYIDLHKTAALFAAAAYGGALLGGAAEQEALVYRDAWRNLGVAFQIKDDIDNEVGDAALLGKPVNSDAKNKKNTYISVFGMNKAREDLEKYTTEAIDALSGICGESAFITRLAGLIKS